MTSASVTPGPATHPHVRHQRNTSSNTPHTSTASLTPYSVGQPLPPFRGNGVLSPNVQTDVRTPSPNYFGLTIDPGNDCLSSGGGQHARGNWSPPTSNVRSTAAASPRVIPLDQNPEFEAFRRQSELHSFNAGRLSSLQMGAPPTVRTSSKTGTPLVNAISPSQISSPTSPKSQQSRADTKFAETKQRSPKRLLSSPAPHITDRPRRNSPAGFTERESENAPSGIHFHPQERNTRFSLPSSIATPPPPANLHHRSDTLPASLEDQVTGDGKEGGTSLVSPQYVVSIIESSMEDTLLLDLRVSTQYTKSRIRGALNLCIPTTLLKRPSYNPPKLAENFKVEEQRRKFERWRSCRFIVVYDANSTKLKDATPCVKMLEKFANEGWTGTPCIIRGGFTEFSRKFPKYISHASAFGGSANSLTSPLSGPLPPVIGGCPMPVTENAANPFFGNIRQNMDLIGGVGQIPVTKPASMTRQQAENLPQWLKTAVSSEDEGKLVSDKFLHIEKKEQKRMQEALSDNVVYGTPKPDAEKPVQLAGIEKGTKNRYNNIWPFEHSRVKLQDVPSGGCDYINANHIKPAWSNKTYIATQGPIPTTFKDFWNVVWQQDVRVIVMLTAEKEDGQLKAHNYWSEKRYGPLNVNFLSEHRASLEPSKIHRHHQRDRPLAGQRRSTNPMPGSKPTSLSQSEASNSLVSSDHPYVTVRKFTLSHNDEPFTQLREITQLQYSNWPDFGAPAHPTHLLGLVEQCDAVVRASQNNISSASPVPEETRPVIVHCSAGCGRTGTFCTVDSVIDMLKRQRRDGVLRGGLRRGSKSSSLASPQQGRSVRQPTPMDLDPKSAGNSFFAHTSPPSQARFLYPGSSASAKRSQAQRNPSFDSSDEQDDYEDHPWIYQTDIDLVEKTVEDFRKQRLSMVQSLRQFVLCYESILEWLIEQEELGGEGEGPWSA